MKDMKKAVIDIGSNSVRLLMWADGKTLFKGIKTTRLGEGLNSSPYLKEEACARTAQAVAQFAEQAKEGGAEEVYAFATAAVRSSKNPRLFLDKVKNLCGIEVDVLSGETEAQIALAGALACGDGAIIDVGGASTEVIIRENGKIIYSKSVNIGTVRILDAAGRDLSSIKKFTDGKIEEYGEVPRKDFKAYAVGGTASRLAAIKRGIKIYDSEILHGTRLGKEDVERFSRELTSASVEQIRKNTICGSSADLIGGGAYLLYAVMEKFGFDEVTVSEHDNLEGYLYLQTRKKG